MRGLKFVILSAAACAIGCGNATTSGNPGNSSSGSSGGSSGSGSGMTGSSGGASGSSSGGASSGSSGGSSSSSSGGSSSSSSGGASSSSSGGASSSSSGGTSSSSSGGSSSGSSTIPDAATGAGGNVISGDPDAHHPWSTIASAWWVGKPDPVPAGNPAVTTVIYLFSKPFSCAQMGPGTGWDTMVVKDTQVLEFKARWATAVPPTATANYTIITPPGGVAQAAPPTAGNAFGIWAVLTATPAIPETAATGNTLHIGAPNAGTDITGTFDLKFTGGTLSGSFDAQWCATGGEP